MIGLPACGKSTKAKELLGVGNTVRINKDLLRTMLHCDNFTFNNEKHTCNTASIIAKEFLNKKVNVIIDDTNLNPNTLQKWKELAKQTGSRIEFCDMTNVDVKTCIERDSSREKTVGKDVIHRMALQYLDYMKGNNVVVCDLDGTLCDCSHRRHFINNGNKDWKNFFDGMSSDTLRSEVLGRVLSYDTDIILVSARPENYRKETENWLARNNIKYNILIMRDFHDNRSDTEVKSDMYDKYLKNLNIIKVFDDRPCVIRMWRDKGLEVEDVGDGFDF